MKNLICLYFTIVCAICTLSAQTETKNTTANTEKEQPPAGSAPKDFKLPKKEVITLDNGLTLVMIPYGKIPKAEIKIMVKTGNLHEKNEETGLSDLLGKLMEEGSSTKNAEIIATEMAAMGGNLNVSAFPHNTNLSSSVLYEFTADAIRLMGEVLLSPKLPAKELDRLKADMKRRITVQLSRPTSQAHKEFFNEMYPNQPHGNIFSTPEKIDSFSIEKIKSFYNEQFGAKRTSIYVAGVFNKNEVIAAVKETFNGWKKGLEDSYPTVSATSNATTKIIDRPSAPQSTIYYGLPVADPSAEDYTALGVTNSILGGSFGSRITSNIREDKGYTYSPRSTVNNYYKSSIWYEAADVTTKFTGASLKEIKKEIELLQNTPPTEEELKGIQNYEAGIFVLRNSTPGGIINQLSYLNIYDLSDSDLTNRVKNIYAVTPEKIQEMAKKYIKPENMTLIVVGDKKVITKQINDFNNNKKKPIND